MTKTKTAKATTRKKTAKPHAPLGLTLLFSMMREPLSTQAASTMYAERSLPLAMQLIERAHGLHQDEDLTPFLQQSVESMYGCELEDPAEPSHVADSSFRLGMAVAWVLMQGLQGREVTR